MAGDERVIVFACTSLVVFMLLHTQMLFVPSIEIIKQMYTPINLRITLIITVYKLHNVLSCMSSSSCRACLAVLFDKLDTDKMHGLDMSNVSSCVMSRHDEPSGIWAIFTLLSMSLAGKIATLVVSTVSGFFL